jgi:hypothetical protein
VGCPCILGEPDGDQGWCSGAIVFDIRSGTVDGTDVGGTRVALAADWPRGFVSGDGTGRLYFDSALERDQRSALEALLGGQLGGVFADFGTLIPNFMASKDASIDVQVGDEETRATVGEFGSLVVRPLRGPTGEITKLLHGTFAYRDEIVLARGTGSQWTDPDMRAWKSGGHAEQGDFDFSG